MEARLTVDDKAVLQRKHERLSDNGIGAHSHRIHYSPRYKHIDHRCRLLQTACLKDKVLQCLVSSIFISTGELHFTVNGDDRLNLHLLLGGNKQHIFVLQGDVGHRSVQDSLNVDSYDLQRAVCLLPVHDGMGGESILGKSLSLFEQRLHAARLLAQLVHARPEHGTFHLNHVGKTGNNGVNTHRVLIGYAERCHIELSHIVDRIAGSRLPHHAHRFLVGIACKAACIVDKSTHALVLLHFIEHGTLHLSRNVDQTVVGSYGNDIVVGQTHIAFELSVQNIVIHVDRSDKLVVAEHLDISQSTYAIGTSGTIQGMEHRGKSRQCVRSGGLHLTHHIHGDGTCLP